ncbi:MAG: flagellar export chaperone FliS [Phycisphaerales bacterium]
MTAAPPNAARPATAYLRTRVLTASPEELRLLLLEGAIKFARQGREGLATKNYEASFTGISRCRDVVLELITSIKAEHDPLLAERVKAVYTFMYTRLVEASMERSTGKLDEVIRLLDYERETWVLLMQKLAKERAAPEHAPAPHAPHTPAAHSPDRPALSLEG